MRMKNIVLFLAIVLTGFSFSQDNQLKVYLSEGQFYLPESGNYIEVQLNFTGYTLNYITEENGTFAEVEISQVFSQNDTVVVADRYLLKSPEVVDSIVRSEEHTSELQSRPHL